MSGKVLWSAEIEVMVREMHAQKKTRGEIAAATGLHLTTIRRHEKLLGLPRVHGRRVGSSIWSTVKIASFTEAWERGDALSVMAGRFGASESNVSKRAIKLGLKKRPQGRRPSPDAASGRVPPYERNSADDAEFRRRHDAGYSLDDQAEWFGVSIEQAVHWDNCLRAEAGRAREAMRARRSRAPAAQVAL